MTLTLASGSQFYPVLDLGSSGASDTSFGAAQKRPPRLPGSGEAEDGTKKK